MWLNVDTNQWSISLPNVQPWSLLTQQVMQARAYLQQHPGQRWLLQQPQREDFLIWLLALLSEGRTPVLPSNGQPETLALLRPFADNVVPQGKPAAAAPNSAPPVGNAFNGQLDNEIILYTSGSSGAPKAIHKSLRQLFNEVATLEQTFGEKLIGTQIVATITHQHIYGLLFTVLWPLCAGRMVHTARIEYPEQWHGFQQQNQTPYVLISSPAQLERFCQVTNLSDYGQTLRAVFSSGGPLSELVPACFLQYQLEPPIEVYGSTETGGIAWRQRFTAQQPFTLFTAIEARQGDDDTLVLRSPHLANNDWHPSNDRVEFVSANKFLMKGRADRIVKLAEKRVSLDEVENYVNQLPWVVKAKCCVLKGAVRTELGLAVELNELGLKHFHEHGKFSLRQRLRQHLSQRFELVVLPRKFRYLEQLPYNDAGKVTEAALLQLFAEDKHS
ncbi:MAG: hypothetical protein B7X54_04365 [Idiomarina sp. 34-48-12]|nr:MAG: hypothetical protein B7X54_04365 [Idiomarina sp. 34-48-12]